MKKEGRKEGKKKSECKQPIITMLHVCNPHQRKPALSMHNPPIRERHIHPRGFNRDYLDKTQYSSHLIMQSYNNNINSNYPRRRISTSLPRRQPQEALHMVTTKKALLHRRTFPQRTLRLTQPPTQRMLPPSTANFLNRLIDLLK